MKNPACMILRALLFLIAAASLLAPVHILLLSGAFLSPSRIVLSVVLPAVAGSTAVVLLFFRPQIQLLGIVHGVAAVLAVFGAELYLEITWPWAADRWGRPAWSPWQRTADIPYPAICGKYVMVVEQDGTIRSVLRWRGSEVQPVGGISNSPYGGGVHSDEHGFFNPPGEWRRAAGQMMAIGDSFAAGADVERGQGFVDLLRKTHGPIVNLGCSWNGPLLELASLIEYGPVVRPRTVLWFFYEGNDLADLELEVRSPLLKRYLEPDFEQDLPRRQATIDTLLKAYTESRLASPRDADPAEATPLSYVVYGDLVQDRRRINWERVAVLQNLKWSQGIVDYGDERHTFALLGEILSRAMAVVETWGGRLIFVYLPAPQRFSARLGRIESDAYRAKVLAEVASLSMPVIDLVPGFARHPRPGSLFDGHYSPAGNELVANEVAGRAP